MMHFIKKMVIASMLVSFISVAAYADLSLSANKASVVALSQHDKQSLNKKERSEKGLLKIVISPANDFSVRKGQKLIIEAVDAKTGKAIRSRAQVVSIPNAHKWDQFVIKAGNQKVLKDKQTLNNVIITEIK